MKWLCAILLSTKLLASERIELYTGGFFRPEELKMVLSDEDAVVAELNLGVFRKRKLKIPIFSKNSVSKWVFMNVPPGARRKYEFNRLPKERMVLFMWEPPIRLGEMYSQQVQSCFAKIYTFRDDLVDNKTYFKFHYPVLQPMREHLSPFEKRKFCTMIVGATSDKSRSYPNELYSKRVETIRFFEENHPEDFEFYGYNWDADQFPSYRGPLKDKHAVNANYKFTICYENCRDLPGYITEKIFDCFAVGSIPIYWGADNVLDYIPKNCFIDRRDFATMEELYQHLKAMTKEEVETYLENICTFLKSEKAQAFSRGHFDQLLAEAIR